jgi:hypothetical protein
MRERFAAMLMSHYGPLCRSRRRKVMFEIEGQNDVPRTSRLGSD